MIIAAGQEEDVRVRASGRRNRLQRFGQLEGLRMQIDQYARGIGNMPKIGEQPVRDVDHGRRSSPGGDSSSAVAHLWNPLRLDEHPRRAETSAQDGETGGGPAQPAVDSDDIAWLSTRPQHWLTPVQSAHHGNGNGDVAGLGDITPEQTDPGSLDVLAEAVGKVEHPSQ